MEKVSDLLKTFVIFSTLLIFLLMEANTFSCFSFAMNCKEENSETLSGAVSFSHAMYF
jgi:hypothetical protein